MGFPVCPFLLEPKDDPDTAVMPDVSSYANSPGLDHPCKCHSDFYHQRRCPDKVSSAFSLFPIFFCFYFSENKFLVFFFKQVQRNESGRYMEDFPYISPCGRERNYIRCDDRPLVFTHLLCDESSGAQHLSYCGGGDKLMVKFEPEKLVMLPENGRVYHPAPEKAGGVGLVKSSLAFELSPGFEYGVGSNAGTPISFHWKGKRYHLTNELLALV
ncbi:UPF0598 protein C8orf82 homolog [Rhinoderma darwinii]|uniref:UPF0598 protein C8orf82 homolog n=1 Tax=Rhinoderma darwinii TaxID=43563 RepID=UPI003F66C7EE